MGYSSCWVFFETGTQVLSHRYQRRPQCSFGLRAGLRQEAPWRDDRAVDQEQRSAQEERPLPRFRNLFHAHFLQDLIDGELRAQAGKCFPTTDSTADGPEKAFDPKCPWRMKFQTVCSLTTIFWGKQINLMVAANAADPRVLYVLKGVKGVFRVLKG